jgi:hypothetical protein
MVAYSAQRLLSFSGDIQQGTWHLGKEAPMNTSPYEESPLEWFRMLEEVRELSERCRDRLTELRLRFPNDWTDSPDDRIELQPTASRVANLSTVAAALDNSPVGARS